MASNREVRRFGAFRLFIASIAVKIRESHFTVIYDGQHNAEKNLY